MDTSNPVCKNQCLPKTCRIQEKYIWRVEGLDWCFQELCRPRSRDSYLGYSEVQVYDYVTFMWYSFLDLSPLYNACVETCQKLDNCSVFLFHFSRELAETKRRAISKIEVRVFTTLQTDVIQSNHRGSSSLKVLRHSTVRHVHKYPTLPRRYEVT